MIVCLILFPIIFASLSTNGCGWTQTLDLSVMWQVLYLRATTTGNKP
jgi:hypothetical protein